ncbi:subclass B1 metallo-beta-lactamase [Maribacter polysiphoniae]|uniref:subclass B1 metallo-beta-lactamase n=1 Tax=Maribacter polysiphoniae TaxID=429344 RepID=UPI002352B9DB|nr:subclass B1 metallo-beta-lactamase [Maribacter polysiphoniae]
MKVKEILFPIFLIFFIGARSQNSTHTNYESEHLKIQKLTGHTYVHISYLETQDYGKVPCNGMIVIDGGQALVVDTPTNDVASAELINWLGNQKGVTVKAVVATHFHDDCLGGLHVFHKRGIPSYAYQKTIDLAKQADLAVPQNAFDSDVALTVGQKELKCGFIGEGHTKDNIVCYYPNEKVLFGGCLIKSVGAGKGYLGDANLHEWSNTVESLKYKYPDGEVVIPGHGNTGGMGLLDYTIEMFKE